MIYRIVRTAWRAANGAARRRGMNRSPEPGLRSLFVFATVALRDEWGNIMHNAILPKRFARPSCTSVLLCLVLCCLSSLENNSTYLPTEEWDQTKSTPYKGDRHHLGTQRPSSALTKRTPWGGRQQTLYDPQYQTKNIQIHAVTTNNPVCGSRIKQPWRRRNKPETRWGIGAAILRVAGLLRADQKRSEALAAARR